MTPSQFLASKLQSPLGDKSARRRTRLMVSGASAAMIAHTGLIPTQIEGLGIQFSTGDQRAFVVILALIVCYTLAAFTLTAVVDFYVEKLRRKEYLESQMSESSFMKGKWEEISARLKELYHPLEVDESQISKLAFYRVFLEVYLPILVGLYGLVALLLVIVSNEV